MKRGMALHVPAGVGCQACFEVGSFRHSWTGGGFAFFILLAGNASKDFPENDIKLHSSWDTFGALEGTGAGLPSSLEPDARRSPFSTFFAQQPREREVEIRRGVHTSLSTQTVGEEVGAGVGSKNGGAQRRAFPQGPPTSLQTSPLRSPRIVLVVPHTKPGTWKEMVAI